MDPRKLKVKVQDGQSPGCTRCDDNVWSWLCGATPRGGETVDLVPCRRGDASGEPNLCNRNSRQLCWSLGFEASDVHKTFLSTDFVGSHHIMSRLGSAAMYAAVMATATGLLARAKRSKIATRAGPTSAMSVTLEEVKAAQAGWAQAIKTISKIYLSGGDYVAAAAKAAGELYGYGHGKVLFKPTKAAEVQFRPEASQAMSYFVGAEAVPDGISEDHGFAINGGKGWSDVLFDNHQIDLNGNVAIAMGNYFFAFCLSLNHMTEFCVHT